LRMMKGIALRCIAVMKARAMEWSFEVDEEGG